MEKELEQFYKVFEIKPTIQPPYCYWECKDPKKLHKPCKKKSCKYWKIGFKNFPPITDTIILELEEIIMSNFNRDLKIAKTSIWYYGVDKPQYKNKLLSFSTKGKTRVLALASLCNELASYIKPQVQELFNQGGNSER